MLLEGKALKYEDNVSTDDIIPAKYRHLALDIPKLSKHAFEDYDAEFSKKIQQLNIIVAGENFGCGSSREFAPRVILNRGIKCIIAKSFGRIFFRNAINIGLLVLECDTTNIDNGDRLVINFDAGEIFNQTKNIKMLIKPLEPSIRSIVKEGGLVNYIKKLGKFKKE